MIEGNPISNRWRHYIETDFSVSQHYVHDSLIVCFNTSFVRNKFILIVHYAYYNLKTGNGPSWRRLHYIKRDPCTICRESHQPRPFKMSNGKFILIRTTSLY
jgi:hypothetical protein